MYAVSSFYRFLPINSERLEQLRSELIDLATELEMCGLILLSTEGINGTIAGSPEALAGYKQRLIDLLGEGDYYFKDHECELKPFRRFKIDLRKELITCDQQIDPNRQHAKHAKLTPSEWHQTILNEDVVLLDTRNQYETDLGVFQGAIDPHIQKFTEFNNFVSNSGIEKSKKVLMYCTGGIRCEKAALVMENLGYDNVFQLEGGILRYLEEYPQGLFEGECFVFDHRVALTNNLKPSSRYKLCPLCGDPGQTQIVCEYCASTTITCQKCSQLHQSCSKNCRHHILRRQQKVGVSAQS